MMLGGQALERRKGTSALGPEVNHASGHNRASHERNYRSNTYEDVTAHVELAASSELAMMVRL